MTGEAVTTTIDFVLPNMRRLDGDRPEREAVVFQPGDGDAGAKGFVPD